jgi:hypothetical protein
MLVVGEALDGTWRKGGAARRGSSPLRGGLVCTTPEPGFGWGGREEGEFLADSGAGGVLLRGGGGDTTTESTKSSIARIPFFLISSRPPLTGGSRLAA